MTNHNIGDFVTVLLNKKFYNGIIKKINHKGIYIVYDPSRPEIDNFYRLEEQGGKCKPFKPSLVYKNIKRK